MRNTSRSLQGPMHVVCESTRNSPSKSLAPYILAGCIVKDGIRPRNPSPKPHWSHHEQQPPPVNSDFSNILTFEYAMLIRGLPKLNMLQVKETAWESRPNWG